MIFSLDSYYAADTSDISFMYVYGPSAQYKTYWAFTFCYDSRRITEIKRPSLFLFITQTEKSREGTDRNR